TQDSLSSSRTSSASSKSPRSSVARQESKCARTRAPVSRPSGSRWHIRASTDFSATVRFRSARPRTAQSNKAVTSSPFASQRSSSSRFRFRSCVTRRRRRSSSCPSRRLLVLGRFGQAVPGTSDRTRLTIPGGVRAGRAASLLRLRPSVLLLDAFIDLFAMDLHAGRRINAQFHVIALYLDDRDLHVVADTDVLAQLPSQEEHRALTASSILPDSLPAQRARTWMPATFPLVPRFLDRQWGGASERRIG